MREHELLNVYTKQVGMGCKSHLQITTPCRNTQIPTKYFLSSFTLLCIVSTRGVVLVQSVPEYSRPRGTFANSQWRVSRHKNMRAVDSCCLVLFPGQLF